MNVRPELVDDIVRNVLARLQGTQPVAPAAPIATATCPKATSATAVQSTEGRQPDASAAAGKICAMVITEDTLQQANISGGSIEIPAGAVITPSGREYLRRFAILTRAAGGDRTTSQTGTLFLSGVDPVAQAAAAERGWGVRQHQNDLELAAGVDDLASGPSLCSCDQPNIVACLLNRNARFRVAVIDRQSDVRKLLAVMRPDVLCLAAGTGWTTVGLRRLMQALERLPPQVPDSWCELNTGGVR